MVRVHLDSVLNVCTDIGPVCEYRSSKSTRSRGTVSTLPRGSSLSAGTPKSAISSPLCTFSVLTWHACASQIFRFANSKNASLFLQRKNPRKIAWTQVYRRMHKKGITEEIAKKRSRRVVKHQRGIVGADLAAIAAKRNQTAAVRTQQRMAAIQKAKTEKKDKETKKKVGGFDLHRCSVLMSVGPFSLLPVHRLPVHPRYRSSR